MHVSQHVCCRGAIGTWGPRRVTGWRAAQCGACEGGRPLAWLGWSPRGGGTGPGCGEELRKEGWGTVDARGLLGPSYQAPRKQGNQHGWARAGSGPTSPVRDWAPPVRAEVRVGSL